MNNSIADLIKKYEYNKGVVLDEWQKCTEEVHKTMYEAYNLAYGQILSDLHDLKELKQPQQEQIKLYEKALDITTDQLMAAQAERNELKEEHEAQPVDSSHSQDVQDFEERYWNRNHITIKGVVGGDYIEKDCFLKYALSLPIKEESTSHSDKDVEGIKDAVEIMEGVYDSFDTPNLSNRQADAMGDMLTFIEKYKAAQSSPVEAAQQPPLSDKIGHVHFEGTPDADTINAVNKLAESAYHLKAAQPQQPKGCICGYPDADNNGNCQNCGNKVTLLSGVVKPSTPNKKEGEQPKEEAVLQIADLLRYLKKEKWLNLTETCIEIVAEKYAAAHPSPSRHQEADKEADKEH